MGRGIKERYEMLKSRLDEHGIRLHLAAEAEVLGWGGISEVSRETGVSRNTIALGVAELKGKVEAPAKGHIRRAGGGRKRKAETDQTLKSDLKGLLEGAIIGDPESPLKWTTRSLANLRDALNKMGHKVSSRIVEVLLHEMGYSLQSNRKREEGGKEPDRDAQFKHIADTSAAYLAEGLPVISIDTKKKELVGNFKNNGKEWQEKGHPVDVNVYDFKGPLGKVSPYGVYDVGRNEGLVNVGITHDTAEFAVSSIWKWWYRLGKKRYPEAKRLYITADGGGSNGSRVKLWKTELQKFADKSGLEISVSHFPPGTSKWNAIEHRLFSFISINWRGKPLYTYATVVDLIAATKNKSGLKVYCWLDEHEYEIRKEVTEEEINQVNIVKDEFHGEWNYTIKPRI
jgi:transposase